MQLMFLMFILLVIGFIFFILDNKKKKQQSNEYECQICDDKDCICEKKGRME